MKYTQALVGPLQLKEQLGEAVPELRVTKVAEQAGNLVSGCKYIYEVGSRKEDKCSLANSIVQDPNAPDTRMYFTPTSVTIMTEALFIPRTSIGRVSPDLFEKSGMPIASIALVHTLVWVLISYCCGSVA